MKEFKDRVSKLVDEALRQQTQSSERWANYLRLFFAGMFASAGFSLWVTDRTAGANYLTIGICWLFVFLLAKLWSRNRVSSKPALITLMDFTVINLGLLLFTQDGDFSGSNVTLYLCYYPLLAVAASRYRPSLVMLGAVWASVFYASFSLIAGVPPWGKVALLVGTAILLALGARSPKAKITTLSDGLLQEVYDKGVRTTEADLMARIHEIFFPPAQVDLPEIWSSSKHAPGRETGGDYFHLFEGPAGPLLVFGDFGGRGFGALNDVNELHKQLSKIIASESSPPKILESLNQFLYEKHRGLRPFTCILAEWQGEEMRYLNAGHLPAIQIGKQGRTELPVTSGPVGVDKHAVFHQEILPFPARDLLVLFTDGVFAKLTRDREQGVAEIGSFIDKFHGGEVNTLCHRIFDCAQPGTEPNADDATVVVIRRQPATVAVAAEAKS
jgi:hypothetical protein